MAYSDPYDPSEPGATDDLSLGDDVIRKDKNSLIERLSTVFDGVPDTDPWVIKDDSITTAMLQDASVTAAKFGQFPHAVIRSAVGTVITQGAGPIGIPMATVVTDTSGSGMTGTANRITVPDTGLFLCTFTARLAATTSLYNIWAGTRLLHSTTIGGGLNTLVAGDTRVIVGGENITDIYLAISQILRFSGTTNQLGVTCTAEYNALASLTMHDARLSMVKLST